MRTRGGVFGAGIAWLVAGAAAAQTTIDVDPSDFTVNGVAGSGILELTGNAIANVGDIVSIDYGLRYLLRFPLDDLPADFATATLELTLLSTQRDNVTDTDEPFENPGLGTLVVYPVPDYATPDPTDYSTAPVGDLRGLILADDTANAIVPADVTSAVFAAKDAALPYVTFRVQTDLETDGDGKTDVFSFATAESSVAESRAVLVYTPEPGPCAASAGALAALIALARRAARR